ncbi:MAG TPA: nuclear transport factor 2 family protein [Devosia sp.]|nr:nuclear transport factor 2 family protein [Devosia sp.]
MEREHFESYVAAFNAKDHEALHSRFFAEDVRLQTLGYVLEGQGAIKQFYAFFHDYVEETLSIAGFHPFATDGFFAEIRMVLTAKKEFTAQAAEANGFGRLPPIPEGASYATTLFIKYLVKNGKFQEILCAEMPDAIEIKRV